MDPDPVKAHDSLDTVMDKIVGASRRCRIELARKELLFKRFLKHESR